MIADLIDYKMNVLTKSGVGSKQITLYCKPLEVLKTDFGGIKGYRVIKVYEVERHLLGESPSTSEEVVFSVNEVPDEIRAYFRIQELYGDNAVK